MPHYLRLLVVMADGEHARFVRPKEDNALYTEVALSSSEAHKRSADLGSDHPGASFHSGSSAHHAIAPEHDLHDLAKEKFARHVAHQINGAAKAETFDELVIAAPAHTLQAIRAALDSAASGRIIGTLAKDLVKTPDHELAPHLSEWVRPVERSAH